MKSSIATTGKALLYGVLFDTNSAVLKPASASQLDEIAKYLVANPKINLLVVGHTDNQGALDFNVELSRKRAAAVVQALVSKQGIDAKRLVPRGVGMLAPVESNRTEAGRVKNRRVELVER
jgi:outer membrane protein OmpA-like peptidoglycan-associated protein